MALISIFELPTSTVISAGSILTEKSNKKTCF
jgi:hypothetical protein